MPLRVDADTPGGPARAIERDQMNRRSCINCQSTWPSLADHELEAPHTCPRCGDALTSIGDASHEPRALRAGETASVTRLAA
jgi:predicted RNA-binding Zn-ribbon protein involved in translation (DUF1610 family)